MADESCPRRDLAAMLHPLTRALVAAELPVLAGHGISMWGYVVLNALDDGPARTQAALALAIGKDGYAYLFDQNHLGGLSDGGLTGHAVRDEVLPWLLSMVDTDEQRRNGVLREIGHACTRVAAKRNVQVRVTPINADAPAACSPLIIEAALQAATENGLAYKKMVSRAYHDSLFMARIAPVGMVFIPCRGGVSHRPDEYSSPQEIENGVKVLASTLARLSTLES